MPIFRQDIKVPIKGYTYVDYEINTRPNVLMYKPVLIGSIVKTLHTLLNNVSFYVPESSVIKYVNMKYNHISNKSGFVTMCLFTKMTTWSFGLC